MFQFLAKNFPWMENKNTHQQKYQDHKQSIFILGKTYNTIINVVGCKVFLMVVCNIFYKRLKILSIGIFNRNTVFLMVLILI